MIRIVEKLENAIQTIILFVIRVTLPRRKIIFAAFVWKTVLWLLRLSSMHGCLSWFIFSYWSELAEWVEA